LSKEATLDGVICVPPFESHATLTLPGKPSAWPVWLCSARLARLPTSGSAWLGSRIGLAHGCSRRLLALLGLAHGSARLRLGSASAWHCHTSHLPEVSETAEFLETGGRFSPGGGPLLKGDRLSKEHMPPFERIKPALLTCNICNTILRFATARSCAWTRTKNLSCHLSHTRHLFLSERLVLDLALHERRR
jgi:hypothetical protein